MSKANHPTPRYLADTPLSRREKYVIAIYCAMITGREIITPNTVETAIRAADMLMEALGEK